jgi:hypothetical protein
MDESQLEAELIRLVNIIRQSPAESRERTKAFNQFLIICQNSLKLIKSNHPDYPEALNKTWDWLGKNIQNFQPTSSSCKESLQRWINGYLYWRIKDLPTITDPAVLPLDQTIGDENGSTFLDIIVDETQGISLLDKLIAAEERQEIQNIVEKIRIYVEKDPDNILKNFYPKGYSQCNCQLLIKRLIFTEPPDTIADIAREFDIKYQTLNTCWQHTKRPNCRKILKEIAYKICKYNYY